MNWNEYQQYHKQKFGVSTKKELSQDYNAYKMGKKLASPIKLNLNKVKQNLPESRKYKHANLEKVSKNKNEGRGSPTRGWAAAVSSPGRERHDLKAKCGNAAFLIPEEEKYPVMNALRNTGGKCEYVCEGISAAKNRSCQYNRPDIAEKANKLGAQHCGWSPKRSSPCKAKAAGPAGRK